MLIKQFCDATGLSRDTVRFYVRKGLLKPGRGSARTNAYQNFDEGHVRQAHLIKAVQQLGFSLKEIAELARLYDTAALDRERRIALLKVQAAKIEERERELAEVKAYLRSKLAWLEGHGTSPEPSFRQQRVSRQAE